VSESSDQNDVMFLSQNCAVNCILWWLCTQWLDFAYCALDLYVPRPDPPANSAYQQGRGYPLKWSWCTFINLQNVGIAYFFNIITPTYCSAVHCIDLTNSLRVGLFTSLQFILRLKINIAHIQINIRNVILVMFSFLQNAQFPSWVTVIILREDEQSFASNMSVRACS